MGVFEGTFTDDPSLLRFAIVIGRFNDLVTEKLLSGCQDCLKRHGVDIAPEGTQVDYVWVPGSFEIPMIARQMAISGHYDAVICLGSVIRGQTPHFDYVSAEAAKGVAAASFQTGVPALNALEMANLMRQIRGKTAVTSQQNLGGQKERATLPNAPRTSLMPSEAERSLQELEGENNNR
jgi:6,7-dimethyl-8-ribityllumazine synthase